MECTRRNFFGYTGALAIAGSTIFNTACFFNSNVFDAIVKYVGVGLQAFTAVLNILSGSGVISLGSNASINAIVTLVKAGFADLQTAVTNYLNAPSSQKATLLGKISVVVADLEGSLQQFWSDLQIPDGKLANTIEGLLGIILSTLAGFATQLPAPAVTTKRALARQIVIPAKKRSVKEFKKDFNSELEQEGFPQYKVN